MIKYEFMSLYTGMPVYILVYNRPINEDDDGIPTHTYIYIYRCRLMMHINRNEPTYNRQTGFQVPPVQCSLFALKPDVIIISYHLSLYIYIHMCVSVCMCLLHLSRAKIFGTMRATSASAATRALSPMFLPRR